MSELIIQSFFVLGAVAIAWLALVQLASALLDRPAISRRPHGSMSTGDLEVGDPDGRGPGAGGS